MLGALFLAKRRRLRSGVLLHTTRRGLHHCQLGSKLLQDRALLLNLCVKIVHGATGGRYVSRCTGAVSEAQGPRVDDRA